MQSSREREKKMKLILVNLHDYWIHVYSSEGNELLLLLLVFFFTYQLKFVSTIIQQLECFSMMHVQLY